MALLNENSKIIAIIDPADGLAPEQRNKTAKYIVLREGLSKPLFAKYIEFVLTGNAREHALLALFQHRGA